MDFTRFSGSRLATAALLIMLAILQTFLAFRGPLALSRTPSLMVAPVDSGLSLLAEGQAGELTEVLEAAFAGEGNAGVKPQRLIAEYLVPRGRTISEAAEGKGALALARELGILRVAEAVLSGWEGELTLFLRVRDATEGSLIASGSFSAPDFDQLLEKLTGPDFAETFAARTPGFTPFDFTFLLFLGLELLLGLLLIGAPRRLLNQSLIIYGTTLFLFALFFARNANMDYVQRFVAGGGELKLAATSSRQQLEVSLRFLPHIVVNLLLYSIPYLRFYFWGGPRPIRPGRAMRSNSSPRPRGSSISASIPSALRRFLYLPPGLYAGWLSGILYAFAHPSFLRLEGLPLLGVFALVPLLLFCRTASFGDAALSVMAFASAQVILINFWHATYSYVSLPFTVLLSLAQWLIVLIPLLYVLRRPGRSWMLLLPALWVVFDWLRGLGFLAYPWGMLGTTVYPWIPYIQLASVTGVWGLTFLLTAVNAALAECVLMSQKRRLPLMVLLGTLLLPLLFGMLALATAPEAVEGVRLLLVQHNRDPRKHDYADSVEALIGLSGEGIAEAEAAGRPVDLVVWPETAFVPDIRYWMRDANAGRPRRRLAERMFAAVAEWDSPLLTGTSDHTRLPGEGETDYPEISYNSTMLIYPENAREGVPGKTYHKIVLVPFTEYFPFKEELPQVYAQLDKFDVSDWTPGSEYVVFEHPKFSFATPICFEDIMPGHVRAFVAAGAEGIVNVSNDYWSLSSVEGMQHGVNGLFRAVENRVPLVRATTSGLTMGVDPYGRILASLPFFEEGALIVDLPSAPKGRSLYTRFGDWFPLLLLILLSLECVRRLIHSRMS